MRIYSTYLLMLSLLLMAVTAGAAQPAHKDRSGLPITIKSNEMTADNKGKTAVFSGSVAARQGDVTIYSDRLTIYYGEAQGDVEKVEADGNVRIIQENRTGTGGHAVYESKAGRITLTVNPRVTQGNDSVTGKAITYFLDDDRSTAVSGDGTRVETVITPKPRKDNVPGR